MIPGSASWRFRKILAVFLVLLAFLSSSPAQAQTYYYTGKNPATPAANDAASAIVCDADATGVIRYNTGTAAFEGCNGVAWADIRNGATAGPAGIDKQVQFNSGGLMGASANFTWNLATGTLKSTIYDTNATTGAYNLGGTTILTYPDAGADTTSFAVGPGALVSETANTLYNTAVGDQAGQFISTGFQNTAVGNSAMQGVTGAKLTGGFNTAVGQNALFDIQGAAQQNTGVGSTALEYNSIGAFNTALGAGAMQGISGVPLTGNNNTAVGTQALLLAQGAAAKNTALGYKSLAALTTNQNNTALGYQALTSATSGPNTAVGYNAGQYISTGTSNTALGESAMQGVSGNPLTSVNNTAVGSLALTTIQGLNAQGNTAVGSFALRYNSTGASNTALGTSALQGISGAPLTGGHNTAVGSTALFNIQAGMTDNTAVGYQTLTFATGGPNTVVGAYAGEYISTGTANTAVGTNAMLGITGTRLTGINNTAVGDSALLSLQGAAAHNTALGNNAGNAVTTGTDNTLLGYQAGPNVTSNSNIVVGENGNITTGASNILIGNSLTFTSATRNLQLDIGDVITGTTGGAGKIGIALNSATAPGTALDVNGGVTMEPVIVTLTANNTVLATANRSYFQVTSDNTTETNRIFCFGAGTLGQILIIEWTSTINRGEIISHGNCGGAGGAVTASLSYTNWAPKAAETILQLMYNGTHWIQVGGSANY